jgi:hypothetical protein
MVRLAVSVAFAAASLAVPAAARAQSSTTEADRPQEITVNGSERQICRWDNRTSSRVRTRICRTAAQWEEARRGTSRDEELQAAADRLQEVGEKISTGCVGGLPPR